MWRQQQPDGAGAGACSSGGADSGGADGADAGDSCEQQWLAPLASLDDAPEPPRAAAAPPPAAPPPLGAPPPRRSGAGKQRMVSHAKRGAASLSKSWAALSAGAADVTRFTGDAAITPPAAAAARARRAALGGGGFDDDGGGEGRLRALWGRLLYNYYLWRQDTLSDLQLLLAFNSLLLAAGGAARGYLVSAGAGGGDAAAAAAAKAAAGGGGEGGAALAGAVLAGAWAGVYEIMVTAFGEGFPDKGAPIAVQVFSVMVAVGGLAAFALVLALVEQVVLEANNRNVKRGSRVYETGHFLVLGWCASQRDLEMAVKVVGQICRAYAVEGGTTVVVMSQREKLEQEELFRRAIPERERRGTRLVFRQGSPLVPADLELGATVVSPDEADAQVVRCAILLDELDDYRGLRGGATTGHVVAELRTRSALQVLRYSCSPRVVGLPTGQLNARRLVKMVKAPFISWIAGRLFNFENRSSNYVQAFPELVGCKYGELPFRFPDASVWGVARPREGSMVLNTDPGYVIREGDALVICRPTDIPTAAYTPLPSTLSVDDLEELGRAAAAAAGPGHGQHGQHGASHNHGGGGWAERLLGLKAARGGGGGGSRGGSTRPSRVGSPVRGAPPPGAAAAPGAAPVGAARRGAAAAPPPAARKKASFRPTPLDTASLSSASSMGSVDFSPGGSAGGGGAAWPEEREAERAAAVVRAAAARMAADGASSPLAEAAAAMLEAQAAGEGGSEGGSGGESDGGGAPSPRATVAFIPTEYMQADDCPVKLLVAGWAGASMMGDLLQELDQGLFCLPEGSEVVLVNPHPKGATLARALGGTQLHNIKVCHVELDPLQVYAVLRLDLSNFQAAIVLCDEAWVEEGEGGAGGAGRPEGSDHATDQPAVLRLDSLMMMVQLNIRRALAERGLPPINIICQKVATAGLTRFEDRHRLPLGISVNFAAFAATMLSIVAHGPANLMAYTRLGECADLTFVDASEYVAQGEEVSYWQVLAQAQEQGDCLMGYYCLPADMESPVEAVVNPQGLDVRGRRRAWNAGDGRLKFIVLRDKECAVPSDWLYGDDGNGEWGATPFAAPAAAPFAAPTVQVWP
ncbi:MAG: hypothetical protein J3K34DRAFT_515852 [Monoraphidium minutum]|nr:MAG: hypothetical protein J3K34DRAFT_515852 [Monoraphidium minutum]